MRNATLWNPEMDEHARHVLVSYRFELELAEAGADTCRRRRRRYYRYGVPCDRTSRALQTAALRLVSSLRAVRTTP